MARAAAPSRVLMKDRNWRQRRPTDEAGTPRGSFTALRGVVAGGPFNCLNSLYQATPIEENITSSTTRTATPQVRNRRTCPCDLRLNRIVLSTVNAIVYASLQHRNAVPQRQHPAPLDIRTGGNGERRLPWSNITDTALRHPVLPLRTQRQPPWPATRTHRPDPRVNEQAVPTGWPNLHPRIGSRATAGWRPRKDRPAVRPYRCRAP